MDIKKELQNLFWIVFFFALAFFMPIDSASFRTAVDATLDLAKW